MSNRRSMAKSKRSSRPSTPPTTFFSLIRDLVSIVGIGAIVTVIFNLDFAYYWLVQPSISVEPIGGFYSLRDTGSFQNGKPIFDVSEIQINLVPKVRYHGRSWPVNQVKAIIVRKGDWLGPYKIEPKGPFVVKEEPVVVKVQIFNVPIKTPAEENPVEIQFVDKWGKITTTSVKLGY